MYKPYRITMEKLSCGISNASILLYAMNNSTFTTRRKQEKSCKNLKQPTFVECFCCDFFAAVLMFRLIKFQLFSHRGEFKCITQNYSTSHKSLHFYRFLFTFNLLYSVFIIGFEFILIAYKTIQETMFSLIRSINWIVCNEVYAVCYLFMKLGVK